jgi:uncharacterized protein
MSTDRPMRTVAIEEHFLTPEVVKATVKDPASQPEFVKLLQGKLLDLGWKRLDDMDASGIDLQVLSLATSSLDRLDPATATTLAHDTNDTLAAAVSAHPSRFAGFGTLNPQEPENAAAEFERCVSKLGFKGVMLNGTTRGLFLDHPRFTPILETAQRLDAPIYLHPAPPPPAVQEAYYAGGLPADLGYLLSTAAWGWHVETGMHCLRMIFTGVFDRFPKLKIIIGHMGEDLPFSIARAEEVFGRGTRRLQLRVSEYFQKHFYITTSGYFTVPPYLCALQIVGSDRILFSVDYPFSTNTDGREFLNTLPASRGDLEKIAHRNAERLLKL